MTGGVCVECGVCGMLGEEGVLHWPAHTGWINMERKESGRSEIEREGDHHGYQRLPLLLPLLL